MSVLDTGSLAPIDPIDSNPVPVAPETPAVDETSGGGAQDSTGSSSGSLDPDANDQSTVVELNNSGNGGGLYRSAAAKITTALAQSAGGSPITLSGFELGVPPNLAAASTLMAQITASTEADASAKDAAFQLLSSDAVLALTSD